MLRNSKEQREFLTLRREKIKTKKRDINKRAIFFTTDALIALMIILLTILVVYPVLKYSHRESALYSDIIEVLSSLKIGEINNSYVADLIAQGKITDLNKSVLEQIGEFYITNMTIAKQLANSVLSTIDVKENVGIWYGDDMLASKNFTPYETAKNIDVGKQTISGIEKGKVPEGFVAKAWLKKITKKENTLFLGGDVTCGGWKTYAWGEYCGSVENNISYKINIPENATIINAWWLVEGSWVNQYNKLYVNNTKIFDGTINYYRIFNITYYLNTGENKLTLYSTSGGDDGASHIIAEYTTPEMQTFHHQTIFPFNYVKTKSVLHYEKSIFLPSEISNMKVHINATRNVTLSFRKANQTIEIGKKNPSNDIVEFTDSEIKNNLSKNGISYSDLKNEYFFFIVDMGEDDIGKTTILGEDSYAEISSSEIQMPFGTIDITQEIPVTRKLNLLQNTFYRYIVWTFFLPQNAIPIIADWQLGWLSTASDSSQKASANGIILYNHPPDSFIEAFSRFGYTPSKANGLFKEGENNFTLEFGQNYGVSNESSYGYLIYFIRSYVNYGEAKEKAQGGKRIIQFEDGSTNEITIGDSNDVWDPDKDAIDDAVDRLLNQLDSNSNNKVDLIIDDESFEIDSLDISGVPYIWSTEVQVRTWN